MGTVESNGPEIVDAHFATNMERQREAAGFSRADLVRRLREDANWGTVHQTTITRIEKGERPVRLGEAFAIARALGVSFEHLVLDPDASNVVVRLGSETARLNQDYQYLVRTVEHWRAIANTVELLISSVRRRGMPDNQPPLSDALESMSRTPKEAVAEGERSYERGMQWIEEELAAGDTRRARSSDLDDR